MEILKILKWGNSSGIRIPKSIMETMDFHVDDQVQLEVEEFNGTRRLLIQSETKATDPTIEELFKNYKGERQKVELQDLEEARGNKQW